MIVQVRLVVRNAEATARALLHVPAAEMELPDGGVVTDEESSPVAKVWPMRRLQDCLDVGGKR